MLNRDLHREMNVFLNVRAVYPLSLIPIALKYFVTALPKFSTILYSIRLPSFFTSSCVDRMSCKDAMKIQTELGGLMDPKSLAVTLFIARSKTNGCAC